MHKTGSGRQGCIAWKESGLQDEVPLHRSRGEKEQADSLRAQSKVTSKVLENIRELPPVLLMDED